MDKNTYNDIKKYIDPSTTNDVKTKLVNKYGTKIQKLFQYKYKIRHDKLYFKNEHSNEIELIQESDLANALYQGHDMDNHSDRKLTFSNMRNTCFWIGIYKDVDTYVRNCLICYPKGEVIIGGETHKRKLEKLARIKSTPNEVGRNNTFINPDGTFNRDGKKSKKNKLKYKDEEDDEEKDEDDEEYEEEEIKTPTKSIKKLKTSPTTSKSILKTTSTNNKKEQQDKQLEEESYKKKFFKPKQHFATKYQNDTSFHQSNNQQNSPNHSNNDMLFHNLTGMESQNTTPSGSPISNDTTTISTSHACNSVLLSIQQMGDTLSDQINQILVASKKSHEKFTELSNDLKDYCHILINYKQQHHSPSQQTHHQQQQHNKYSYIQSPQYHQQQLPQYHSQHQQPVYQQHHSHQQQLKF